MNEDHKYYITDNLAVSERNKYSEIIIDDHIIEFSEFFYIKFTYAQMEQATNFENLINIINSLIQVKSYRPIESWIKYYFTPQAFLILKGWVEEGYHHYDISDIFRHLILLILTQHRDSQAHAQQERIIVKILAEGYFIIFLKKNKDGTLLIYNLNDLKDVYDNLRPFHNLISSTSYDKLDVNLILEVLIRDFSRTNHANYQITRSKFCELCTTYFQNLMNKFISNLSQPKTRPSLLSFYENLFQEFLNQFDFDSKIYKNILSLFIQLPQEFVGQILVPIVRDHEELKEILINNYSKTINANIFFPLVEILEEYVDEEKKEVLVQRFMDYLLIHHEEFFIHYDVFDGYKIIYKPQYPDFYLNEFEKRIPITKLTLKDLIFKVALQKHLFRKINTYITVK
ncbi:hypothetical protein LCGC14_2751870, partial [marine sediment metagenome]